MLYRSETAWNIQVCDILRESGSFRPPPLKFSIALHKPGGAVTHSDKQASCDAWHSVFYPIQQGQNVDSREYLRELRRCLFNRAIRKVTDAISLECCG